MKKAATIILIAATMAGCAVQQHTESRKDVPPMTADSARSFATALLGNVEKLGKEENFCLSPASALWAMAMTADGARSTTAREIYTALGYPTAYKEREAFNSLQKAEADKYLKSKSARINIANSIWVKSSITAKEQFIGDSKYFYDAHVENNAFDAQGIKTINKWCSDKSEGKITSILDKPSPSTQMLLVNTLYFKAQWAKPFYKEATASTTFTKADGSRIKVPMMMQRASAPYYEDSLIQATRKHFELGEYSMLFILPKRGVSIESAASHLASLYNKEFCNSNQHMVMLSLPRFKSEYATSLKPALKAMGIKEAFTNKASFDDISDTSLKIDDVIQKTVIEVNEDGAEAAAVTAVQMMLTSARRQEKKVLTLDRPFIYAITAADGKILFIGKMGNPLE